MALVISPKIRAKLADKDPPVADAEIEQCFANRRSTYLIDKREQHRTIPPTRWFVAETDFGRKLKIAFVPEHGNIYIRTAYNANEDEIRIYNRFSAPE